MTAQPTLLAFKDFERHALDLMGLRRLHFGATWFHNMDRAMTPVSYLIDELVNAGEMSLVFGPSQAGKSFFTTHLALAVARGEDVFGRKVRRGGVIYIAAESERGFITMRLPAYRKFFDIPRDEKLPFLVIPTAIDLFAEEGDFQLLMKDLDLAAEEMEAMGVSIDLTVIDTFAAVSIGANENASEDMSRLIKRIKKIQEVTRGHVMIVHHKNAAGDKPRGHTSLYAAVDTAIEVMCDEQKNRTAKVVKQKDGPDGESIAFRLQGVTIGTRDDGKPITSCVVVAAQAQARSGGDQRKGLTAQAKVALQALRDAIYHHGESAPGALELPFGIRVVKYQYWKTTFASKSFEGDDANPDTIQKALKRSGEQLLARGIIGRNNPYVWIAREPEGLP